MPINSSITAIIAAVIIVVSCFGIVVAFFCYSIPARSRLTAR